MGWTVRRPAPMLSHVLRYQWEYQFIELKTEDGRGYDWHEVGEMGDEGWEAVTFIPLPQPDPQGVLNTTVGYVLFKRPKP